MLTGIEGFHKEGSVYVRDGRNEFSYSDGRDVEEYLKSVLKNATDLGSDSAELEEAIHDWATEYHLSSKRANLLRGFDFTHGGKVLELGCGCGAITRFLGEQGLSVDAVEGSPVRAEIASLRCRDLENVTVYCGNFNDMELPERHYDLICLVGVAEYAARFMGGDDSGDEPVVRLLAGLRRSLGSDGIVLLAIENRTGMKYVLGAHEDHYGKRLIGLNNYFGTRDINTYTLVEWERMFRELGVVEKKVFLPFPDYKVPTVILSQDFVTDNPHAFCNLEGVQSRDYVDLFKPPVGESLFWQSAAASNSMDVHSNSFLFVFSLSGSSIGEGFRFDFAHLPGFGRRREFCLVTVKPENRDVVERRRLVEERAPPEGISQRVVQEPYYRGTLLSVLWARALEIDDESGRFLDLVRRYVSYLELREEISIDLTSSNIVVDEEGALHAFDEEWMTSEPVSVAFLLFRSLLVLVLKMESAVRSYARRENLETVQEFVVHVGDAVGVDIGSHLDEFVEREEEFQAAIARERTENRTRLLLDISLKEEEVMIAPIKTRLYWRTGGEPYSEDMSRSVFIENTDEAHSVTIALPPAAGRANQIRFSPCEELRRDGTGFMRLSRLEVFAVDPATQARTSIWAMVSSAEIAKYASMAGLSYVSTGLGELFMITDDDPWLQLPFIPRVHLAGDEYLEFKACLRFPRTREYLLAKDRYLTALDDLDARGRGMEEVYATHERIREELSTIKGSGFWRAVTRYRAFRHDLKGVTDKLAFWRYLLGHLGPRRTLARARVQGGRYLLNLIGRTPETAGPPTPYEVWRETRLNRQTHALPGGPLISVIMPVHNVSARILRKAIQSVERQTYGNWELCIADDASSNTETLEALKRCGRKRIKVAYLAENRNISAATNAAVELARGRYLAFMDNDDELADNALYEVASAALEGNPDCMYTDEDFIKLDNHLDFPHLHHSSACRTTRAV
jgi:SAM-dependent methyltransferase